MLQLNRNIKSAKIELYFKYSGLVMWTRFLIGIMFFLGVSSGKAIAVGVDFEYVLNGSTATIKLDGVDTSGGAELNCNATGTSQNRTVLIGFLKCNSSGRRPEGAVSYPCDGNSRFDEGGALKSFVQHYGIGSPFTIKTPQGVSDGEPICLTGVSENSYAVLVPGFWGQGAQVPSFVTCSLGTNSLAFTHGNLTGAEVNGNTVSLNLSVTCSDSTSVNITAGPSATSHTGSISLSSDGSLVSNISANGIKLVPQGTILNLPKGMSSISVSSTLHARNDFNKAGSYSGNGVLTISPQ